MAHNRQRSRPVLKDEIRYWVPKHQRWLSLDETLYLKSLNSKEEVTAPADEEIRSQELLSRGPTRVTETGFRLAHSFCTTNTSTNQDFLPALSLCLTAFPLSRACLSL